MAGPGVFFNRSLSRLKHKFSFIPSQVVCVPDHCPLAWHVLVALPLRSYPSIHVKLQVLPYWYPIPEQALVPWACIGRGEQETTAIKHIEEEIRGSTEGIIVYCLQSRGKVEILIAWTNDNERTTERTNERTNKRTDEWMNGWMDEWMNERMKTRTPRQLALEMTENLLSHCAAVPLQVLSLWHLRVLEPTRL